MERNGALECKLVTMPKRRRYGSGSVYLHGRTWGCKYYANGVDVRESTGCDDRTKAEQWLKERIADATAGRFDAHPSKATVTDLCRLVIADYRLRKLRDVQHVEWR